MQGLSRNVSRQRAACHQTPLCSATRPHVKAPATTASRHMLVPSQALCEPSGVEAGSALGLLVHSQTGLLGGKSTITNVQCQTHATLRQQRCQHQGSTMRQGSYTAWPLQLQPRPVYRPGQLQQLVSVLQGCSSIEQLKVVVGANLHLMPPSCLVVAVQQIGRLQRQQWTGSCQLRCVQQQQQVMSSQQAEAQLVAQLSSSMVQQLPVASCEALTAFVAAAAAGRLLLPCMALQRISAELVHTALRATCQQRQQRQRQSNAAAPVGPSITIGKMSGGHYHVAENAAAAGATVQVGLKYHQQASTVAAAAAAVVGSGLGDHSQNCHFCHCQQQHPLARSSWALAKLGLRHPAIWMELSSLAGEHLHQLSVGDCVLLSWALAKSQQHSPRLFNALQHRLKGDVQLLSPDAISCLLWSYAAVGHYHYAGTAALITAAASSMERFGPRSLTCTLWACVKLRHFDPRLLSALRVKALASMQEFLPQSLATLLWGLASFGVRDSQLVHAVAQQALAVMPGFSMQGLANLAWGAAKTRQQKQAEQKHPAPNTCGKQEGSSAEQLEDNSQLLLRQLICSVNLAAVPLLPTAKPREVCNLLWASAVLQHRDRHFLAAACSRLVSVAADATPHDLAQAMWALQLLNHRSKHTQQALARQALNKLHMFGPQALSNWSWAVAAAGMRMPACTRAAVAQQCQVLLPRFTPQGLATTLWAISKMGRVPQQLLHEASKYILANIACYNAQDICNISMVCAKAGYREPALLQGLTSAASSAAAATSMLHRTSSSRTAVSTPALVTSGRVSAAQQLVGNSYISHQQQLGQQSMVAPASHVLRQKRLTPQGICNLVWAFAGMGWHDPVLLKQLQQLAAMAVFEGQLTPENIAGLVQGFALLGEGCTVLFDALKECRSLGISAGSRPAATKSSPAVKPPQYSGSSVDLTNSSAVNTSLISSSRNSSSSTSVTRAPQQQQHHQTLGRWQRQLCRWPAGALALLAWGGISAGAADHSPDLLVVVLEALSAVGVSGLSERRRAQLHLALTLLATRWGVISWAKGGALGGAEPGPCSHCSGSSTDNRSSHGASAGAAAVAPPRASTGNVMPAGVCSAIASAVLCGPMARHCARAWRHEEAASLLTSTEEEVLQVLQSMGLQPVPQRWIQPAQHDQVSAGTAGAHTPAAAEAWSGPCLRVVIGVWGVMLGEGQQPVAIEVLTAKSVSSSWPVRVLGLSLLKHQCLRAAGWRVLLVSAEQWDTLGGQRTAQQQLLSQLLDQHTSSTEPLDQASLSVQAAQVVAHH